jgi:hypothetical protein
MNTPGLNNTISTTVLKGVQTSSIPTISDLSTEDFKRFVFTGYSVSIPLPLVKTSSSALFGINVDGFIPPYNMCSGTKTDSRNYGHLMMNFCPVQVTRLNGDNNVKVYWEACALPQMVNYISHRFISGNVGVGLRISSTTSISGNLLVTQLTGALRDYYGVAPNRQITPYKGLTFLNSSICGIDYSPESFAVLDMSLNRNLSITPIRRDPTVVTDFARKIWEGLYPGDRYSDSNNTAYNNKFSQYTEDWLLFTPMFDMGPGSASSVNISIFFDFSKVNFYVPLYPVIPMTPAKIDKQVMKVSESIFGKSELDRSEFQWRTGTGFAIPVDIISKSLSDSSKFVEFDITQPGFLRITFLYAGRHSIQTYIIYFKDSDTGDLVNFNRQVLLSKEKHYVHKYWISEVCNLKIAFKSNTSETSTALATIIEYIPGDGQ